MNPTITLAEIRAQGPCADDWRKLLASLGGADTPLDIRVTLGDIARSNGANDALWCVRCLDWSNVAVRRAVVGAILLGVERASVHTTDTRVHDCIASVRAWVGGDDVVDLAAARDAAWAASAAAWDASAAAREDAASSARDAARAASAAAWAAWAAARAARDAASAAVWAAAWAASADIIAMLPPLHPARVATAA